MATSLLSIGVIYRVRENQKRVEVLHIRHGARRTLQASDLS